MKIIKFSAENIKRLSVVEITPGGNLVQITGQNASGKTSVLDALWWCIAGASHIQAVPIRRGATEARIRLDLGEICVTRTFKAKDDQVTTAIVVENAEGMRAPSPQKMLDSLLGALSFDPLAFTRMDAKAQFDAVRRFVPGIDFDAIDVANKRDYEARTDINRRAKEQRTLANKIEVPPDLPADPIDESALVDELQLAGAHNADIERRRAAREQVAQTIERNRTAIPRLLADYQTKFDARQRHTTEMVADLGRQIKALQARIIKVNQDADRDLGELDRTTRTETDGLEREAAGLQKKLDQAPELPSVIDVSALRTRIDAGRQVNQQIEKRQRRDQHAAAVDALERQSANLTAAMDRRNAEKQAAITAAKMPVDGLGFGAGIVTLNGVPFDQASDAEQLRASIAIAMAENPKLRVVRVRDGSLLDEDGLRMLAEMADAHDCQVWIERVDGSGKVGFVLEDGHIKTEMGEAA